MLAPRCKLTIQDGDGNDRRTTISLDRAMVIGRDVGCDVRVDAPSASARHASLRWTGTVLEVRDLSSSFGTFVDESRVSEWTKLGSQSVVWIGDAALRFELIWQMPPIPIRFTSAEAISAFTISQAEDTLTHRELVDFPQLHAHLPLRFPRTRGLISAVVDGTGRSYSFESGRVLLAGVELQLHLDDDSLASIVAPTPSSLSSPQEEPDPAGSTGAEVFTGSCAVANSSEPGPEKAAASVVDREQVQRLGVSKGTGQGGTGADRLMLLMGIAALIALGAFAAWILQ